MKNYSYEIKYNKNGEIIIEYMFCKMILVTRYIEILTDTSFDCSELKALRNGTDITAQINKFLMK